MATILSSAVRKTRSRVTFASEDPPTPPVLPPPATLQPISETEITNSTGSAPSPRGIKKFMRRASRAFKITPQDAELLDAEHTCTPEHKHSPRVRSNSVYHLPLPVWKKLSDGPKNYGFGGRSGMVFGGIQTLSGILTLTITALLINMGSSLGGVSVWTSAVILVTGLCGALTSLKRTRFLVNAYCTLSVTSSLTSVLGTILACVSISRDQRAFYDPTDRRYHLADYSLIIGLGATSVALNGLAYFVSVLAGVACCKSLSSEESSAEIEQTSSPRHSHSNGHI